MRDKAVFADDPRGSTVASLWQAARYADCRPMVRFWVIFASVMLGAAVLAGGLGLPLAAGCFALGWLGWTFIEYCAHRWFQHWVPKDEALLAWREGILPHLKHHARPLYVRATVNSDPLVPLVGFAAGFLVAWAVVPWPVAMAIVAGNGIGFMVQELIHFAVHQCGRSGPWLEGLRRHHLFHHFRDDSVNFGLSTGLWDRVFGTYRATGGGR